MIAACLLSVVGAAVAIRPAAADDDDINTVAGANGTCASPSNEDLHAADARTVRFTYSVAGIAANPAGTSVLIADATRRRVHQFTPGTGRIDTVAGTSDAGAPAQGTDPLGVSLLALRAVAVAPNGEIYVVTQPPNADPLVQRFTPGGEMALVGSLPGLVTTGRVGLAVDAAGTAYVAAGSTVRSLSRSGGNVATIVTGLSNPEGAAVDAGGHLYVANTGADQVLRVDLATGVKTVIAPAEDPKGIAVDAAGKRLYVAEFGTSVVSLVTMPAGAPTVDPVVGTAGSRGSTGDGDDASKALLNGPLAVATDGTGKKLFVFDDTPSCAIRYVASVPEPKAEETTTTAGGTGSGSSSTVVTNEPPPRLTAPAGDPTPVGASQGVEQLSGSSSGASSFTSPNPAILTAPNAGANASATAAGGAGSSGGGESVVVAQPPVAVPPPALAPPPAPVPVPVPTPAAVPLAGGSPTANPGLVAVGAAPAQPAARYAMVANDDDGMPLALAGLGLTVAASGCVVIVTASRAGARRRPRAHRPAWARAW